MAMFRLDNQVVRPEWIDNNGHMNIAYYTLAFDLAFDQLLAEQLGMSHATMKDFQMGPFALQNHYCYHAELREDDTFYTSMGVLDYNHKCMHLYGEMFRRSDNVLSATWEGLTVNVSHVSRKTEPYPAQIMERIVSATDQSRSSPLPPNVGKIIRIRKS